MLLIAKKRLRYPRGEGGVEYQPGDTFETQTERDGQALLLVRLAEEPTPRRAPRKTLTLKTPDAIKTTAPAEGAGDGAAGGVYLRRDMRPEE